jgi:hypothetical protein
MKKTFLALTFAISVAASQAATYNIGVDTNSIYLGFYSLSSVSTKSMMINLGDRANILSQYNLDLSSASSLISQTYGTNWYSSADVYWGVIGFKEGSNVWMGKPDVAPLLKSSAVGATDLSSTKISSIRSAYGSLMTSSTNGTAVYDTVISGANTHQISVVENSATTFSGQAGKASPWGAMTVSVVSPLLTGGIDIQEWTKGGSTTYLNQSTIGKVTVKDGVISVVPEPSTYALTGFGALLLILAYRRKTAA